MQETSFDAVLQQQIAQVQKTLGAKAKEYATRDDKLHNFKVAAVLQNCTPEQALLGMLTKHTVSIADMVNSGQKYPLDTWDEKITDHINYLILLKAQVLESQINPIQNY